MNKLEQQIFEEAAELAKNGEDSLFKAWLVKKGISIPKNDGAFLSSEAILTRRMVLGSKGCANNGPDAPVSFEELCIHEFDRSTFDHDSYLQSLSEE